MLGETKTVKQSHPERDEHVITGRRIVPNILRDALEYFLEERGVAVERRGAARAALEAVLEEFLHSKREVSQPKPDLSGRERWKLPDGKRRRGESPVAFVKRVYPDREALGLIMPDIKRADPDLYMALAQWKSRNPDDPELVTLGLPTLKEKNDLLLATHGVPTSADAYALLKQGNPAAYEAARLSSLIYRRQYPKVVR